LLVEGFAKVFLWQPDGKILRLCRPCSSSLLGRADVLAGSTHPKATVCWALGWLVGIWAVSVGAVMNDVFINIQSYVSVCTVLLVVVWICYLLCTFLCYSLDIHTLTF
jgi:hypothetical protein